MRVQVALATLEQLGGCMLEHAPEGRERRQKVAVHEAACGVLVRYLSGEHEYADEPVAVLVLAKRRRKATKRRRPEDPAPARRRR